MATDLLYVVLDAAVAGVHHVTCQLEVAVHHERLVRLVCVDSDSAHVIGGVLSLTLLPAQLHVRLELTRVGRLRAVTGHQSDRAKTARRFARLS